MNSYHVEIEGSAPLLQNKIGLLDGPPKKSGDLKDSAAKCADKLYLVDGKPCQPAIHLEMALLKAGQGMKQAGTRGKSYKDLFKGSVFVKPDMILHKHPAWEVHATTVVVPATRGRIARYRPMFPVWTLAFQVDVLDDRLTADVLKQALDEAGRTIGIGDWRPRFGRFLVTKFGRA